MPLALGELNFSLPISLQLTSQQAGNEAEGERLALQLGAFLPFRLLTHPCGTAPACSTAGTASCNSVQALEGTV